MVGKGGVAPYALMVLFSLIIFVASVQAQSIDSCECGYEEDEERYCRVEKEEVKEEEGPVNGTCVAGQTWGCKIDENSETLSVLACNCRCGYKGDLCEIKIEPPLWNFIVGLLLPFGVLLGSIFYMRKCNQKDGGKFWKLEKNLGATSKYSSISPTRLFMIRIAILIYALTVEVYLFTVLDSTYRTLKFFTQWNWLLVIFYFSLSVAVSYKEVFKPGNEGEKMGFLEKLHWVVLETALPSAMLVFVVYWTLLFPLFYDIIRAEQWFTNVSQHALNIVFMFLDFVLCRLKIVKYHIGFLFIWTTLYALFHQLLLLGNELSGMVHCPAYFFLSVDNLLLGPFQLGLMLVNFVFFRAFLGLSNKIKADHDGEELNKSSDSNEIIASA